MSNWLDALRAGAQELGLSLTEEQETRFGNYLQLLLERNEHVNLTAITDPVEVAVKHFVDSLSVELVWRPQPGDLLIDIGTGAGLPGIPMAIRHPEVTVVLNDSMRKKVDFLSDTVKALGLENAIPNWERAEVIGRDPQYRAQANVVVARALAHLAGLIEYGLPLLKTGGTLIAMKGPVGQDEASESARALSLVGGKITEIRRLKISGAGERQLIVVTKMRATPFDYPRDPAAMKKKPLRLDSGRGTP